MIEDMICETAVNHRAIKLVSIFLRDYLLDNICSYIEEKTKQDRLENTLAIIYSIELLVDNLSKINEKYYKLMYEQNYSNL